MTGVLSCRIYEDGDLPGLLSLWDSQTGWGTLTAEMWRAWHRDTPWGDAIISVLVDDDNQILGQMVFTPSRVRINGECVKALRMSAPIVSASLRGLGIKTSQPFYLLYKAGAQEGIRQGARILYSFPVHKWLGAWERWKRGGNLVGRPFESQFGCVEFDLKNGPGLTTSRSGITITPVSEPSQEHASLWERASVISACAIERSALWLKYNSGSSTIFEARDGAQLLGYAAVRPNGLLADFFVGDEHDRPRVLEALVAWLAKSAASSKPLFSSFKAMCTPHIDSASRGMGATRSAFDFAFIGSALDDEIPVLATDPEQWYLMPGD